MEGKGSEYRDMMAFSGKKIHPRPTASPGCRIGCDKPFTGGGLHISLFLFPSSTSPPAGRPHPE